jgi:MHS family proline/betaine transporter-like MFS transporter
VLFGVWGDRHGRRFSLALAMVVMGAATFAAGLLPTFADAGILAPALLVLLRLVQGLSMGGHWSGGGAFIVEYAPQHRRGMYGGVHVVGATLGILAGSLAVLATSTVLDAAELAAFGWRIPFFVGALTAAAGVVLRLGVEETPAWRELREAAKETNATPMRTTFRSRQNRGAVSTAFGVTVLQAVNAWVLLVWIVTFLTTTVGLGYVEALLVNSIGLAVMIVCLPLCGLASDRFGRKRVMLTAAVAMFLLITPVFLGMRSGSLPLVIVSYVVIVLCHTLYAAPQVAMLVELFPTSVRVTGLSIGSNISQTIFGGFAAFIASLLVTLTGDPSAATWYVMAGAAVSAAVLVRVKETAFSPLR